MRTQWIVIPGVWSPHFGQHQYVRANEVIRWAEISLSTKELLDEALLAARTYGSSRSIDDNFHGLARTADEFERRLIWC